MKIGLELLGRHVVECRMPNATVLPSINLSMKVKHSILAAAFVLKVVRCSNSHSNVAKKLCAMALS